MRVGSRFRLITDHFQKELLQVAFVLGSQCADLAFDLQFALMENGDSVAHCLDFAQFMGRKEDGFPLIFEAHW
jgi:hypothetical protein